MFHVNFSCFGGIAWQKGGNCMDQPTQPPQGFDFDLFFLITVVVSALLAIQTLSRTRQGQVTGLYPISCAQTALTLANCGYFFTQALQALAEADPKDQVAVQGAQAALLSVGLDFVSSLIQWQLVQVQRRTGQLPDTPITAS